MDDHDRKAVASLRERLEVTEAKLRLQQRWIIGCAIALVAVLLMIFLPGIAEVVGGILLVVAIVLGVLLFISAIMAVLEWLSPSGRIPK